MKFSVGYQMTIDKSFINEIIKNKEQIEEVYFSWGDFPNGRNLQSQCLATPWESIEQQIKDIKLLKDKGLKFNLLFNGNCYGKYSLARAFYDRIGNAVEYIKEQFGLSSITTTSPMIAKFIKNNFTGIKTRASVNMEIGTPEGMDYVSEYFDGFYMKREYNRNFEKIEELKGWCEHNNKTLHILANSGCLNNCSAHNFHDNIVAHEQEIMEMDNCYEFNGICHEYLKNALHYVSLIKNTSFIRPEDVKLYEKYFDSMKLATRVSDKPIQILRSYVDGKYVGNVLELLEPNHAGRIYPYLIENSKINNSYLFCDKNCSHCNKCYDNYKNALVNLSSLYE